MSDIEAYIFAQLDKAFRQKHIDLGWWCPRCDVAAYPQHRNGPPTEGDPGWCPLCGLDPRADGPAQDKLGLAAPLRGPLAPGPIEGSTP